MAYKVRMLNGSTALWVTTDESARLHDTASASDEPLASIFYGMPAYVLPEPKTRTWWQRAVAYVVERWRDWRCRMHISEEQTHAKSAYTATLPTVYTQATRHSSSNKVAYSCDYFEWDINNKPYKWAPYSSYASMYALRPRGTNVIVRIVAA